MKILALLLGLVLASPAWAVIGDLSGVGVSAPGCVGCPPSKFQVVGVAITSSFTADVWFGTGFPDGEWITVGPVSVSW